MISVVMISLSPQRTRRRAGTSPEESRARYAGQGRDQAHDGIGTCPATAAAAPREESADQELTVDADVPDTGASEMSRPALTISKAGHVDEGLGDAWAVPRPRGDQLA